MINELISHLESFISDNRKELFNRVIAYRTRYITVVLEDIYQPHNASAILRTCDCFGIQDVHIIENKNKYEVNRDVALGSDKWLTLKKYKSSKNNSLKAISELRKKKYRIVATSPHQNDINLKDLNLSAGKIALFFGTELQGLTREVIQHADNSLKIPMYGFTESYNISVSAAIILHTLTEKMRTSAIQWKLTEEEKTEIKLLWLKRSIKKSNLIEKEFLMNQSNNQSFT